MQILGILVGAASGVIWELLSTTPYKNYQTLVPSLFVNSTNKVIHVHHWLFYFLVLVVVILVSIKSQKAFHPSVLMIMAFLSSAILYNFYKFGDWYKFFK